MMAEQSRIRGQIDKIEEQVQKHSNTLEDQNEKLDIHIHQLGQVTQIVQHLVDGQKTAESVAREYRKETREQMVAARIEQQALTLTVTNVGASVQSVLDRVNAIDVQRHKDAGGKEMLGKVLNMGWIVGTVIVAAVAGIVGYVLSLFPSGRVK